jgi:hypothetical protein
MLVSENAVYAIVVTYEVTQQCRTYHHLPNSKHNKFNHKLILT